MKPTRGELPDTRNVYSSLAFEIVQEYPPLVRLAKGVRGYWMGYQDGVIAIMTIDRSVGLGRGYTVRDAAEHAVRRIQQHMGAHT